MLGRLLITAAGVAVLIGVAMLGAWVGNDRLRRELAGTREQLRAMRVQYDFLWRQRNRAIEEIAALEGSELDPGDVKRTAIAILTSRYRDGDVVMPPPGGDPDAGGDPA